MTNFRKYKNEADSCFEKKDYREAEKQYRQLFNKFPEACNRYDALHHVQCLKATRQYRLMLNRCRQYFPQFKDFTPLRTMYALSIWYTEIKFADGKTNPEILIKAARATAQLCRPDDTYAPYALSILKAAGHQNMPPEDCVKLTNLLTPDFLSDKPYTFIHKTGKKIVLPSELEKYFLLRSKALYKIGQYKEARETAQQGLHTIKHFRADNAVWLKRMVYLSLQATENYAEAVKIAEEVSTRQDRWFLKKELSELYRQNGQHSKALNTACDAALQNGDPTKKVRLYSLLAQFFEENKQIQDAQKHRLLEYNLRTEKGWRISEELKNFVSENSEHKTDSLLRDLRKLWQQTLEEQTERFTGKIINILAHGKAGFIKGANGKSHYFSIKNFRGKKPTINRPVSFELRPSYDKKKQKASNEAVNIRVL